MAHYSASPWPVVRITGHDVMAPRALVVSISNLMVGKDCGAYSGKVNADQKGKFNACKALIITSGYIVKWKRTLVGTGILVLIVPRGNPADR